MEPHSSFSDLRTMQRVSALCAAQDGLATIAQLRGLGVASGMIRQRVTHGEWQRLSERVIGVGPAPRTWRREVRAALLATDCDGAVSHSTAARLHRFDGFDRDTAVHITTFGLRHYAAMRGVTLHRSTILTVQQCDQVEGLVCVSRPIALVQVSASHGRAAAAKALDSMLRRGDNPLWIQRVASGWRTRGRHGPATVLELLNERVDGRLPRSWFQRLAKEALATSGQQLVDEHPVVAPDGTLLAELDLAIPHLQIGIECQSWEWHSFPGARTRDARRKRRLRLLGWELIEIWWSDLERMDEVLDELRFLVDRRTTTR